MEKVCLCMDVSKEEIIDTIKSMNIISVTDVNTHTIAGTSCGKCTRKIEEILNSINS
jgi:NAD(P)H-nitrite reductase large subunit